MKHEHLTDAQVDSEITRLRESPFVKLAEKEQRIRLRRKKYMYQLRWLDKRGRQLAEAGYTMDSLDELDISEDGMEDDL